MLSIDVTLKLVKNPIKFSTAPKTAEQIPLIMPNKNDFPKIPNIKPPSLTKASPYPNQSITTQKHNLLKAISNMSIDRRVGQFIAGDGWAAQLE